MTENAYWKKLADVGWLKWLPEEDWADIRSTLKRNLKAGGKDAWLALAQGGFEAGGSSAAGVVADLAGISRGVFSPKRVKGQENKLSFEHSGKRFECELEFPFELEILDLVNRCLAETGKEPRFFILPGGDDFACVVFVPPDVYQKAIRERLICSKGKWELAIAELGDAAELARHPKPEKRWPACWMTEVDASDFTELCKLVGDSNPRPLRACHRDSGDGTVVFVMEVGSATKLAALPDKKIPVIAKRWMNSPGLKGQFQTESEADWFTDKLYEMQDLATKATAQKRLLMRFRLV